MDYAAKSAAISSCGRYRYCLSRAVRSYHPSRGERTRYACFIMLNPSTADADTDDPTIRKCAGFVDRWNFDGFHVVNLFAYRATNPAELAGLHPRLREGKNNFSWIKDTVERSEIIILGWGSHAIAKGMGQYVVTQLAALRRLMCFGQNMDGSPKHPLYLPYSTSLQQYLLY